VGTQFLKARQTKYAAYATLYILVIVAIFSVANTLAALNTDRVELAPEPVYADATWVSSYRIDPFTVPLADKITVLDEYSGRLLAADGVDPRQLAAELSAIAARLNLFDRSHVAKP